MQLEIIATSVDDALTASRNGADRIELINAFNEGGLTPDKGLVYSVLEAMKRDREDSEPSHPPAKACAVHVMIRPHSRSFVYDKADVQSMREQIKSLIPLGIDAFVLGALNSDHTIDDETLQRLLDTAEGRPVTFHRAFDHITDQEKALDILMRYPQVKWILTSGGQSSALQAVDRLRRLNELSQTHQLTIMAGSGLTIPALPQFLKDTAVTAVHLGTGVRQARHIDGAVEADLIRQARVCLDSQLDTEQKG